MRSVAAILLAAAFVLTSGATAAAQCSMCRLTLASADAQIVAAALRAGIGVLLLTPFLAFALIAFVLVRARRRLDSARRAG